MERRIILSCTVPRVYEHRNWNTKVYSKYSKLCPAQQTVHLYLVSKETVNKILLISCAVNIWPYLLIIIVSHVSFSGHGTLHSTPSAESTYERKLFRVRETLSRLKRTTDSAALGFLSRVLDTSLDENEQGEYG